jgi:hypothetical protein
MSGRAIPYSTTELQWIKRNCGMPRAELHAEFCKRFERTDVPLHSIKNLCKRNGWHTGRTGQFAAGQPSPNKGKKTGPAHPNQRATLFKAGAAAPNAFPLGHERLRFDGYVEIKIARRNPYTGHKTHFVLKHLYLWEEAHGPVPKGMALKCLDGDKTNTDPANWVAVPRGLLPRLNGKSGRNYDRADPALKPTIMAIARLEQQTSELRKGTERKEA